MTLSAIPRALRIAVLERDQGRCRYCNLQQIGQVATFHIDHVLPRSRGGATALPNLVLECPWCSLHKSNKVDAIDSETAMSCRCSIRCRTSARTISKWKPMGRFAAEQHAAGQRLRHCK